MDSTIAKHEQGHGHDGGRRLRTCTLCSVADVTDAFGEDKGLVLCRIEKSSSCCSLANVAPFFTIPEGVHALVQRGGRDVDFRDGSATWPAGLHWSFPWKRPTHLVTKQSIVYQCSVKRCVTKDNVAVTVRATVVIKVCDDPMLVRKFVYEMGVRGLETQLDVILEEGIRVMARSVPHEVVYCLGSGGGGGGGDERAESGTDSRQHRSSQEHQATLSDGTTDRNTGNSDVDPNSGLRQNVQVEKVTVELETQGEQKQSQRPLVFRTGSLSGLKRLRQVTPEDSVLGPSPGFHANLSDRVTAASAASAAATTAASKKPTNAYSRASVVPVTRTDGSTANDMAKLNDDAEGGGAFSQQQAPSSSSTSSVSTAAATASHPPKLPAIRRGLRASRIVPEDVANAAGAGAVRPDTEPPAQQQHGGDGGNITTFTAVSSTHERSSNNGVCSRASSGDDGGDRKRRQVHPVDRKVGKIEAIAQNTCFAEGLGIVAKERVGGVEVSGAIGEEKTALKSHNPPLLMNFDLSPSPSLSGSVSLPKLDAADLAKLSISPSARLSRFSSAPVSPTCSSPQAECYKQSRGGSEGGVRNSDNGGGGGGGGGDGSYVDNTSMPTDSQWNSPSDLLASEAFAPGNRKSRVATVGAAAAAAAPEPAEVTTAFGFESLHAAAANVTSLAVTDRQGLLGHGVTRDDSSSEDGDGDDDNDGNRRRRRARQGDAAAAEVAAEAAAAAKRREAATVGRQQVEKLRQRLRDTMRPQGVDVVGVVIQSAELPEEIVSQMCRRTLAVSKAREQRADRKLKAQAVRHEGETKGLLQRAEIERGLEEKESGRVVEQTRQRLRDLRTRAEASVAAVAAMTAVNDQRLMAESRREVSRIKLRENAQGALLESSADRSASVMRAEVGAFCLGRLTEATFEESRNRARAKEAMNSAEGKTAGMVRAARCHLLEGKRLEVWNALAQNKLSIVTASPLVSADAPRTKQQPARVDATVAMMLSESGFQSQPLLAPASEPSIADDAVQSRRKTASSSGSAARLELEAQLAFATGAADFAVRIGNGPPILLPPQPPDIFTENSASQRRKQYTAR